MNNKKVLGRQGGLGFSLLTFQDSLMFSDILAIVPAAGLLSAI